MAAGGVDPKVIDPANRFLWRFPVRRPCAEQIRDAMLAVSGELDLKRGRGVEFGAPQRTVYVKMIRNQARSAARCFDLPDRLMTAGDRNVTTTPDAVAAAHQQPGDARTGA